MEITVKHTFVERMLEGYERIDELDAVIYTEYEGYDIVSIKNDDMMVSIVYPVYSRKYYVAESSRAFELKRYLNYIESITGIRIQGEMVDYIPVERD